jgi:uncharacterized protein with PIN domain
MAFKFATDRTLGKLAKWLRILGFDTQYVSGRLNRAFIENLESERIFLTRIHEFRQISVERRIIFIKSNDRIEQLKQVIHEAGLTRGDLRPFSRCASCNRSIVEIHKDIVVGRVPDYIWETHDVFNSCPECERIYWPGSHTSRTMEQIDALFLPV